MSLKADQPANGTDHRKIDVSVTGSKSQPLAPPSPSPDPKATVPFRMTLNPLAAGLFFSAPLFILISLVHGAMLALAWPHNPGSAAELVFFATGALLMALSAAAARSFSALCLAAFLWLGLWLKFIVHLFYLQALVEPIGAFDGSMGQYDTVMLASGTAFFAASLSFLLVPVLRLGTIPSRRGGETLLYGAAWSQFWTYLALLGLCVAVALINLQLGIFQVGIAPRTILPWPGNALISLFLTTGYFFAICYFIHCDYSKGRSLTAGLFTLIVGAAVMSSSLLSRGVVVLHMAAVLLALAVITWRQRTGRALVFFAGALVLGSATVFATIGYVEAGREISFAPQMNAGTQEAIERLGGILKSATFAGANNTAQVISQLAVGRWIGVEGAMVAAGNTGNSPGLMAGMLAERAAIGKNGQYQYLSGSLYVVQNGERFQFATIPGPVATFLFGGSIIYVFVGVFALCLLAMAFEKLSQFLTRSEFVTCFVAIFAANSVAQFGLTPVNQLPQVGYMLVLLFGFWGARSIAPYLAATPLRHLFPAP